MAVQLRNALTRCGWTQPTADYVIRAQGYNSTEELLIASQDGLDTWNFVQRFTKLMDGKAAIMALHPADYGTFVDKHGRARPRITTQSWKLLVEWKNGLTSWVSLKNEIKESFSIETAEYAVANKTSEEPAFIW